MVLIPFLLFLGGIALFTAGTLVVLYHFHAFRLHRVGHPVIVGVFLAGSVILFFLEFSLFRAVSWDAIFDMIRTNMGRSLP